MFYACFVVYLGVFFVLCRSHNKKYSLNKFSSLSLFRGHMDSHSNDYITPKLFLSGIIHQNKGCLYVYIFYSYAVWGSFFYVVCSGFIYLSLVTGLFDEKVTVVVKHFKLYETNFLLAAVQSTVLPFLSWFCYICPLKTLYKAKCSWIHLNDPGTTLHHAGNPCSSQVLIMLIVSSSFRNEKVLCWSAFRRDTLSVDFFGLANRYCPILLLPASPAFCLLSVPSTRHPPLHSGVVKSAIENGHSHFPCAPPQSCDQPDFPALNRDCSESRKSQKSFTLHIASYLVVREGSTDWRQLFLLVGLAFTD